VHYCPLVQYADTGRARSERRDAGQPFSGIIL
jgi:hypothetical protein